MEIKVLQQYSDLIKEKEDIKRRLENIKKRTDVVSDVVQNGLGHMKITGVDWKRKELIDKYENLLIKAQTKVEELKVQIEEFIQNIEDSNLRQIFRYKYLDDKNWIQIGFLMKATEDKVRKKHDRFLKKFQK